MRDQQFLRLEWAHRLVTYLQQGRMSDLSPFKQKNKTVIALHLQLYSSMQI